MLPYHPLFFATELISQTFTNTIWDACTELTKQMDILEISRTGQVAVMLTVCRKRVMFLFIQ
jgi:hypothetical protein